MGQSLLWTLLKLPVFGLVMSDFLVFKPNNKVSKLGLIFVVEVGRAAVGGGRSACIGTRSLLHLSPVPRTSAGEERRGGAGSGQQQEGTLVFFFIRWDGSTVPLTLPMGKFAGPEEE